MGVCLIKTQLDAGLPEDFLVQDFARYILPTFSHLMGSLLGLLPESFGSKTSPGISVHSWQESWWECFFCSCLGPCPVSPCFTMGPQLKKEKKGNVFTEVFVPPVNGRMFTEQPVLLCSPLWVQDLSPRVSPGPRTTWSPTLALALGSYRGSLPTAV